MRNNAILAAVTLALCLAASPGLAQTPKSIDPAAAPAGHYELDPSHASVLAKVSHMGLSSYTMRFDTVAGRFDYDPAQPTASQVSVVIDANSLDVGDVGIGHKFAREFLGADKFPQITFVSTAIQETDATHGVVTGDLTLNGVTRPVALAVTFNGSGPGLMGFGGYRMGFSAATDVKRSDFGSKAWQGVVGDAVHLVIEAEFSRK